MNSQASDSIPAEPRDRGAAAVVDEEKRGVLKSIPAFGETTRQAGLLFSAQTVSMFANFGATLLLARFMDPTEMGRFAFCLSIVTITALGFELGLSYVGARVLALEGDRESERQALGAILLLTIILSSCFALFVAASAVPIDLIFHKDVRWLLISTAALAFFQPFQPVIEQCCQGLNQIHRLSVFQLMTSGCNILLLAALIWLNRLTAATALGVYLIGIGIAAVWTIFRLRPRFSGSWRFVRYTLAEIRRYGINLYLARIAGMASTRVDQLVIAYFIRETAPLAMYAVVQKFANPITMAGRSLALTRFRAFARASAVSKRIARWNTAVLLLAASGLIVAGPPLIRFFFPRYAEAAWLLFPFAIASLFTGLFQPYNIFLSSHGRGRELRNIVLIVGSISLATLFFAVPRFGIGGAAWTAAGAMALDYLLHLHYYREFKRSSSQADMRR